MSDWNVGVRMEQEVVADPGPAPHAIPSAGAGLISGIGEGEGTGTTEGAPGDVLL